MIGTAYVVDLGYLRAREGGRIPIGECLLRVHDDGKVEADFRAEPHHVWTPVSYYSGSIRVEEQGR